MKYIFDVHSKGVNGIIEVEASGDQEAIAKVNNLGLKFSSMRPSICVYHIQYTMKDTKRWKLN